MMRDIKNRDVSSAVDAGLGCHARRNVVNYHRNPTDGSTHAMGGTRKRGRHGESAAGPAPARGVRW
eukprot:5518947-Prymnesium_polylepis.1